MLAPRFQFFREACSAIIQTLHPLTTDGFAQALTVECRDIQFDLLALEASVASASGRTREPGQARLEALLEGRRWTLPVMPA